jgi:hypothetical protein
LICWIAHFTTTSKALKQVLEPERRATVRLFDDGHVDGVVREQDFADVAEQDVDSLFPVDFLVAVHRDHDGGGEFQRRRMKEQQQLMVES